MTAGIQVNTQSAGEGKEAVHSGEASWKRISPPLGSGHVLETSPAQGSLAAFSRTVGELPCERPRGQWGIEVSNPRACRRERAHASLSHGGSPGVPAPGRTLPASTEGWRGPPGQERWALVRP